MGLSSICRWLLLGLLVALLFGRGRFSALMEDLARGMKGFRRTLRKTEL